MVDSFVNLETIGDGALAEQFDFEMQRVLKNIADPNTSPTATRKITIVVEMKPDENRETIATSLSCKSTLVGQKPTHTALFLEQVGNSVTASEFNRRHEQKSLFQSPS